MARITLRYTNQTNFQEATRIFESSLTLSSCLDQFPALEKNIIDLSTKIAKLTSSSVAVTCIPAGLSRHPVSIVEESPHFGFYDTVLSFRSPQGTQNFRIYAPKFPHELPFRRVSAYSKKNSSLRKNLIRPRDLTSRRAEHQEYFDQISEISELIVELMSYQQPSRSTFEGFHPHWLAKKSMKKSYQSTKRLLTQDARNLLKALKAEKNSDVQQTTSDNDSNLKHGTGRAVGARPGIYKGVLMRSQLEIGFAAELDERQIEWFYESEALGEAQYLVDFYLPKLKTWIEVKGRLTAKDKQVLPQIAKMLKQERQQRLLMFTSSGVCYLINPSGFREIERKSFWKEVFKYDV